MEGGGQGLYRGGVGKGKIMDNKRHEVMIQKDWKSICTQTKTATNKMNCIYVTSVA